MDPLSTALGETYEGRAIYAGDIGRLRVICFVSLADLDLISGEQISSPLTLAPMRPLLMRVAGAS